MMYNNIIIIRPKSICVDLSATTPQELILGLTIGIATGITVLVVIIAICLVIIIVVACYCQKKQLKLKQKYKDDVTCEKITVIKKEVNKLNPDCSDQDRIKNILNDLDEVKKYVRTASDSSSDDTEQLDLEGIEQALRGLLSKTVQKKPQ